jgi:electron transfer flavoprotein beta subunit
MLKLVVCIKQVPMVSELPWNAATGTLRRELAEGMMDPASKQALEAALYLKEQHGGHITTLTMGPPMAEEVLHEAAAAGADRGILLTDPRMAGADTYMTAAILSKAIQKECSDFDLVMCGCQSSDSETAQVGPQLADELDIPEVAYVERMTLTGRTLSLQRISDDFYETLEMDLPGLLTIDLHYGIPRYVSLGGLQTGFEQPNILCLTGKELGLDPKLTALKASPTRIINVYSPTAQKENIVLRGTAKKVVDELFLRFGEKISGAMGKDLKTHEHD